jgi:chemotaxis protein MotB
MRRKHVAAHENHERWLVSYADFITLLFAFFVVMFATTQSDKLKAKDISDSVREALEHGQFSNAISMVLGRGKHENSRPPLNPERVEHSENLPPAPQPPPHPADLKQALAALQEGLRPEAEAGKVVLKLESRGLVISLREAAFFSSGDDAVNVSSFATLSKIGEVIRELPNPVRLEGHTDWVPIHNSHFRSNWELSAARAIAMMEVLAARYGISRSRMAIAGYAENAPADTNETEVGRAHNRRVDLVLLTQEGLRNEPQMPASAVEPRSMAGRPRSEIRSER